MCLTILRDQWNGTIQTVSKYTLLIIFSYLDFLPQKFTIHWTAREKEAVFLTPLYHFHPTTFTTSTHLTDD